MNEPKDNSRIWLGLGICFQIRVVSGEIFERYTWTYIGMDIYVFKVLMFVILVNLDF